MHWRLLNYTELNSTKLQQTTRRSKSKYFCAIKMHRLTILRNIKHVKLEKKQKLCNFSGFVLTSPKFSQILKYDAQSWDCMISDFRNSASNPALKIIVLNDTLNCTAIYWYLKFFTYQNLVLYLIEPYRPWTYIVDIAYFFCFLAFFFLYIYMAH